MLDLNCTNTKYYGSSQSQSWLSLWFMAYDVDLLLSSWPGRCRKFCCFFQQLYIDRVSYCYWPHRVHNGMFSSFWQATIFNLSRLNSHYVTHSDMTRVSAQATFSQLSYFFQIFELGFVGHFDLYHMRTVNARMRLRKVSLLHARMMGTDEGSCNTPLDSLICMYKAGLFHLSEINHETFTKCAMR